MYSYCLYGLNIESDIELRALLPSRGEVDVVFRLGQIQNKPPLGDRKSIAHWSKKDAACITYKDIATFLIQNGNEIIIEPEYDKSLNDIVQILLGVAISVILYQRGFLVLHCSLIEVDGYAIGFLGHSGFGKSSLATTFYEKGYHLISDDLGVIEFNNNDQIDVYAGYPQFKLWSDTIETIGINPNDLPYISSKYNKRTRLLTNRFVKSPRIPLKCLYVLDIGDEIEISEIKGYDAIIELVEFTFDIQLIEITDGLAKHFDQCAKLAKSITIKRLQRPWSLDSMPKIIQAIENDVAQLEN